MVKKCLIAACIIALMVSGCTAVAEREVDKETLVAKMATERWRWLIQGKTAEAYQYLSPATRSIMPLEKYQGSIKPGIWRDAKVTSVDCSAEDLCRVAVDVSYTFRSRGMSYAGDRVLTETWRKEEGKWWFVPD